MSKIYVVTAGVYSDYHICAVFESRELAEEYKEVDADGCDIEEYELNNWHDQKGFVFKITMRKNGDSFNTNHVRGDTDALHFDPELYKYRCINEEMSCGFDIHVRAKDVNHAVKIANEVRVRIIAQTEWDKLEFNTENNDNFDVWKRKIVSVRDGSDDK